MSENMEERLEEMEAKKTKLEELINQRQKQINARAAKLKEDIEERFQPKEIIREYPLTTASVLFGAGFVIARSFGEHTPKPPHHPPVEATPPPASAHSADSSKKSDGNLSGIASELAFEFLNAMKDVLLSYAIEYATEKFKEKISTK